MNKPFCVNVVRNKKSGQMVLSLPKKQLSKNLLKDFDIIKKLKIKVEGWE